jgi:thioredoxin 1
MNNFELLHFTATWCNPCKKIAPIILSFIEQNIGLKYTKIDVDSNTNMVKEYNVLSVPTLIVLKDEKVFASHTGTITENQLINLFK